MSEIIENHEATEPPDTTAPRADEPLEPVTVTSTAEPVGDEDSAPDADAADAVPPMDPATPLETAGSTEPATVSAARSAPPLSPAECGQQLRQLFPSLFGGTVKPLKLRIQVDIQERAPGKFSKQTLSAFFRRHTGSTSYLIAMTKAPSRFDLDGQPAGDITEEHRQVALEELARRRNGQEERRQLEEQQRRNRAGLLHDFKTTTLTRANFCALKGVPVDELDGLLEIARGEAEERARHPPVPRHSAPPDRPGRPEGERSGRGGRRRG